MPAFVSIKIRLFCLGLLLVAIGLPVFPASSADDLVVSRRHVADVKRRLKKG